MVKTTVKHGVLSAGNLSMDQLIVLLASSNVAPPCVADGSALKTRDGNATCKLTPSTGFSNAGLVPQTMEILPCVGPNDDCGRMYKGIGTEMDPSGPPPGPPPIVCDCIHGFCLIYFGCHWFLSSFDSGLIL